MRERLKDAGETAKRVGITPAYAGKTHWLSIGNNGWRDHPRVCGKDNFICNSVINGLGSPPRMRERHFAKRSPRKTKGITPAYAGKTHGASFLALKS